METGWAILETVPDPMYTAQATKKSKKSNKDACYHEAKRKFKVFPSAYASGAIAKCRKAKGKKRK